jgi:transcriptional regulator GlxA family with amidase domain
LTAAPDKQWTSGSLATSVGLSASQLRRKFVAQTGLPPMQYLRQLRLKRAMELLLTRTYWTVKEVGAAVGFCDMSHFVRAFRQRNGQSPTQYRRAHGVRPTNHDARFG